MYSYDRQSKTLYADRIKVKRETFDGYKESDQYISYRDYINEDVVEDIKSFVIKEFENFINGTETGIPIEVISSKVRENDTYQSTDGTEATNVFISLRYTNNIVVKEFCCLRIPKMDMFGVLHRDGREYSVNNSIELDNSITFNEKSLDIICDKRKIALTSNDKHNRFKLHFTKNESENPDFLKFTIYQLLEHGLCQEEVENIFKNYRHNSVLTTVNKYLAEAEEQYVISKFAIPYENDVNDKSIERRICNDSKYSISTIREDLNELLSINRGLHRCLSRDIIYNGEVLLKKGEVIQESTLQLLNENRISTYFVTKEDKKYGYYIAMDIPIVAIQKGTKIPSVLRQLIPDMKGEYASKDIIWKNITGNLYEFLPIGTLVDDAVIEVLTDCILSPMSGFLEFDISKRVFKVSRDADCKSNFSYMSLEEEIMNNRYFYVEDEWVYNETGNKEDDINILYDHFTCYDFVALLSLYPRLLDGEYLDLVADKDASARKCVYQFRQLAHRCLEKASKTFVNKCKSKIRDKNGYVSETFMSGEKMSNMFYGLSEEFWHTLFKSKYVTEVNITNPSAYVSYLNRASTLVENPEGVAVGMRYLSMGYFGRICPFETPASKKLGLTNTLAIGAKIENTVVKTSYYRLEHGDVNRVVLEPIWLSIKEEEKYIIASILDIKFDYDTGVISNPNDSVLARVPAKNSLEKMIPDYVPVYSVDLINTDTSQILGAPTTTIPFVGSNDTTRTTFGVGMSKQTRPLLNREIPIVSTDAIYDIPRMNTKYMICAEDSGEVTSIMHNKIEVMYDNKRDSNGYSIFGYNYNQSIANSTSVVLMTPTVRVGDKFNKGDVLVSSNFIKDGLLATGVNILVAYIPMRGYNYEDGVYISEFASKKLTSYGYREEEVEPPEGTVVATSSFNYWEYIIPDKTKLNYLVNSNNKKSKRTRRTRNIKGFIIGNPTVTYYKDKIGIKSELYKAIQLNPLTDGDKLCNRHGNKGVVPRIEPNSNMPYFKNGEFIHMVLNPVGTSSRMNMGQIKECLVGFSCHVLGIKYREHSLNTIPLHEIIQLVQFTYRCTIEDIDTVCDEFNFYPEEMIEDIKANKDWIKMWEGCYTERGTAILYDAKTDTTLNKEVLVGINYYYKLVQEVEGKAHSRGFYLNEPYVKKLDCPTHGARNDGGQSYGYMELDALMAYGASNLIYEMQNARSDNSIERYKMIADKLGISGELYFDDELSIRRSVEYVVELLSSLGIWLEFTEDELPNNTIDVNERKFIYQKEDFLNGKLIKAQEKEAESAKEDEYMFGFKDL